MSPADGEKGSAAGSQQGAPSGAHSSIRPHDCTLSDGGIGDVVHSLSLSEMCDEADGIGGYAGEGAPVHVRACDLIDRDGQLLGMLRSTRAMAALVRPDGHVGALAGDVESSLAAVQRACPPLPTNGP